MNLKRHSSCSIDSSDEIGVVQSKRNSPQDSTASVVSSKSQLSIQIDAPMNVALTHKIETTDKNHEEELKTIQNMFNELPKSNDNIGWHFSHSIENIAEMKNAASMVISPESSVTSKMRKFNRFGHSTSPFLAETRRQQELTFEDNSQCVTSDEYEFQANEESKGQTVEKSLERNGDQSERRDFSFCISSSAEFVKESHELEADDSGFDGIIHENISIFGDVNHSQFEITEKKSESLALKPRSANASSKREIATLARKELQESEANTMMQKMKKNVSRSEYARKCPDPGVIPLLPSLKSLPRIPKLKERYSEDTSTTTTEESLPTNFG